MARVIRKIIVHCSDSNWGDLEELRRWHKERGFYDVGYHYIILNGYLKYRDWKEGNYQGQFDGVVVGGRREEVEGAHCEGQNRDSLGVCLIGVKEFTLKQMQSLELLCVKLIEKYKLKPTDVYGHYEFNARKSCPNFNVEELRKVLRLRFEDEKG